ncbi:MAG: ankyrin repeat domain-containing protein [Campylobacterales bacterium]
MVNQLSQREEERFIELQLYALNLAREGEVETLLSMLQAGLHPNTKDTKGNSLLMLSAYNGHYECSKMLIEQGANVNESNDHGHSILAGVAFKGYLEICRLLVENGAVIDRSPLRDPILFASIFGRKEVVNYLQSQTESRAIYSVLSNPMFWLRKLKKT